MARTPLPAAAVAGARPPTRELLIGYRWHFAANGVTIPLRRVPVSPDGLLGELPAPLAGRTGWPWTVQTPVVPVRGAPLVSVVVPTFRQAAYLEEALRSILLQNYPALELIVLDGGSTDGSAAILERYAPWLSYVRSGPDRGQGNALNLGFALASGECIGWLNSDDAYLPGTLHRVGEAFAADPALEFLHGDDVHVDEPTGHCYYNSANLALDRYLHFGGLVFSHAVFWRHAITEPVWEAMQCNVDGELWHRLLRGARRRHLPLPLGMNRSQPAAKTVDPRWKEAWAADDQLIWAVHGRPPARGSWLPREFHQVQRIYRLLLARRWRSRRKEALANSPWQPPVP